MRHRETVSIREHLYVILGLLGLGFFGFVIEVMRRLSELNGHHEEIKENQALSVTRHEFDQRVVSVEQARELALNTMEARVRPLEDFRSRAYGMAVVIGIAAAVLGGFVVKALS